MIILAWSVVGLAAGMLVNLAADLLPERKPLRAAFLCPRCTISWPQVRWPAWLRLVLAKRCPGCGATVPLRAVLTELGMGMLLAYGGYRFGGSSWVWLLALHALILGIIFVVDLEHRLVPNPVIIAGAAVALLGSLAWRDPPLSMALFGGLLGYVLFLLFALAKPGAMGMGAVKLAGLIGLVVGYPTVLSALFSGIVVGGIGALVLLLSRRVSRTSYVPYAPFLAMGAVIALLRMSSGWL